MLNVRFSSATPDVQERILEPIHQGRWTVVIFNNDHTLVDDVIFGLMQGTGCTVEEATIEVWEAQTYGRANVHFSDLQDCEAVARIMQSIGVKTVVEPEWKE